MQLLNVCVTRDDDYVGKQKVAWFLSMETKLAIIYPLFYTLGDINAISLLLLGLVKFWGGIFVRRFVAKLRVVVEQGTRPLT